MAKKSDKPLNLSALQQFTMERISRHELKNAEYNPRVISEVAKKRLRANLKKIGLIQPIIWNKRSGNILGGHQRISAIDAIEGTKDYLLDVAVVDMDEKTEREQNIFLNNEEAQGNWDMEKLQKMFEETSLDVEATGFDAGNMYEMFGQKAVLDLDVEHIEKLAQQLRDFQEGFDKIAKERDDKYDEEFYAVLVFRNKKHKLELYNMLDRADETLYLDGQTIITLLNGKT
jgi:hypothetical protein